MFISSYFVLFLSGPDDFGPRKRMGGVRRGGGGPSAPPMAGGG